MTVASSLNKHTYKGNGVTTEWPYSFKITQPDEIKVYLTDPDSVVTKLESDYWIDVDAQCVIYPGYEPGTEPPVEKQPPILPEGWQITLLRVVPLTQELDLVNQGPFFAEAIESALDKLTMIAQQHEEALSRSVQLPVNSDGGGDKLLGEILDASSTAQQAANTALQAQANAETAAQNAANDVAALLQGYVQDAQNHANDAANYANQAQTAADDAANSVVTQLIHYVLEAQNSATEAQNSAAAAAATAASIEVTDTPEPNKILRLNTDGKLPASITGDAATVGGKTPGTGANNVLVLDANGKVPTANLPSIPSANLPIASASALGAIKVGSGLSISNGVLSVSASSGNQVAILTGTIAHGGTIPLPSGYTADQCKWFVSPSIQQTYGLFEDSEKPIEYLYCSVNASRVVTCGAYCGDGGYVNGTANYIIIGVK